MTAGNVVVIGSFMMDLVVRAPHRPRPGETIVGNDFQMFLGGKGFNQAVAAARCGARTCMVGRVGDDDFGRRFLEQMAREEIDASCVVVDPTTGTGIGAPVVDDHGENSIVIVPRANWEMSLADLQAAAGAIERAGVLLLQLELPHEVVLAAARMARNSNTIVVLNPAPAPAEDLIGRFHGLVDILVPNEIEAATLGPSGATDIAAAAKLGELLGAAVVMTLGSRGCLVVTAEGPVEVPPHDVPIVDTVGAGDAFCGALGAFLSGGASLVEAVSFANAAGAIAVTRRGAEPAMPRRHEVIELAGPSPGATKPVTPSSVTRVRSTAGGRLTSLALDRREHDRSAAVVPKGPNR